MKNLKLIKQIARIMQEREKISVRKKQMLTTSKLIQHDRELQTQTPFLYLDHHAPACCIKNPQHVVPLNLVRFSS